MRATIVMPLAQQRGGAELLLEQLVRRSSNMEWVVAFLEDGPMVARLRASGVVTRVIPAGRLRDLSRYASTVLRLARFLREQRADVVLGWMTKAQLYSGPAGVVARVPSLWYQLGLPSPPDILDRIATALPAKEVIAVSKATGRAQANVRPHRPIRVVYPGVELDRFDPAMLPTQASLRRTLGLPMDCRIIGIFGRLQAWKGMHFLINAMPQILTQHPDSRCVVVGGRHALEPDYEYRLRRAIRQLALEEHVTLVGVQPNVPEWMNAVDVVVHASRNEPFGIVLLEAMALGKPLIAGSNGGPREVVTHGVDGLLVPYGDVTGLASCLVRLLSEPRFAARLGQSARRRASDFSIERYSRGLESAVRDAIDTSG
jgi:glycosyltransferase involved in cell wall biosynthesis